MSSSGTETDTQAVFGVDIHVGRLLYDTQFQRFGAVESYDVETQEVKVALLSEVPEGCGGFDTPHGSFIRHGWTLSIEWPTEGGRFIPK